MANSFIGVPTDGTGKKIDTWTVGTNHRQAIVIGDSAGTAVATVSTSAGLSVNVTNTAMTVAGTVAVSAATVSGTVAVSTINSKSLDFAAGTATTNTLRVTLDSGQVSTLGQTAMAASAPVTIPTDQTWKTGMSNRAFKVDFATLTRPANTTAYTAADSISDNSTAGSVTALVSGNISDVNDDPIFISDILVKTTDTGLAGKKLRAYVFNSDPTASSGVGAGDNATYSQKQAGYIGSFMGWMETGFSDGAVGRLVPCFNETNFTQAGGFITVKPVSGARTLYIQYQAVEAFTPSANSTTIIGSARGWQGRAS